MILGTYCLCRPMLAFRISNLSIKLSCSTEMLFKVLFGLTLGYDENVSNYSFCICTNTSVLAYDLFEVLFPDCFFVSFFQNFGRVGKFILLYLGYLITSPYTKGLGTLIIIVYICEKCLTNQTFHIIFLNLPTY